MATTNRKVSAVLDFERLAHMDVADSCIRRPVAGQNKDWLKLGPAEENWEGKGWTEIPDTCERTHWLHPIWVRKDSFYQAPGTMDGVWWVDYPDHRGFLDYYAVRQAPVA